MPWPIHHGNGAGTHTATARTLPSALRPDAARTCIPESVKGVRCQGDTILSRLAPFNGTLAGNGSEPFAERFAVIGDELGTVAGAAELDVEGLLNRGIAKQPRQRLPAAQGAAVRSRSASRDRRCTDSWRFTAMARARGSATSTTRRLPRVTPV